MSSARPASTSSASAQARSPVAATPNSVAGDFQGWPAFSVCRRMSSVGPDLLCHQDPRAGGGCGRGSPQTHRFRAPTKSQNQSDPHLGKALLGLPTVTLRALWLGLLSLSLPVALEGREALSPTWWRAAPTPVRDPTDVGGRRRRQLTWPPPTPPVPVNFATNGGPDR
jgi:hypothetical protein